MLRALLALNTSRISQPKMDQITIHKQYKTNSLGKVSCKNHNTLFPASLVYIFKSAPLQSTLFMLSNAYHAGMPKFVSFFKRWLANLSF